MKLKMNQIRINKETAFQLMDCRKDNPMYEEMEELYEEIWQEMKPLIKPCGLLGFARAEKLFQKEDLRNKGVDGHPEELEYSEAEYAMVIYTLGKEVSEYSGKLFAEGDYLKGMLADAMADSCLFAMEEDWKPALRKECKKRQKGIGKRMEAPVDFSMETQQKIWELLQGDKMDVSLTSGYMLNPVKSCCYLFLLTDNPMEDQADHDCSRCPDRNCKLRLKPYLE